MQVCPRGPGNVRHILAMSPMQVLDCRYSMYVCTNSLGALHDPGHLSAEHKPRLLYLPHRPPITRFSPKP